MAVNRQDNAYVLLSYNWHHQKLARKIVTNLRSAGFQVRHALEKPSEQAKHMQPFCIIPLLSQAYEDSAATRRELMGAVDAGAKVVSVLVEQSYAPHDWVKEICDETVLIHMPRNPLELSPNDFKDIMVRLNAHLSTMREKGNSRQLLEELSKEGTDALWTVEDPTYYTVANRVATNFLYVCVECNIDIQEINLSTRHRVGAKHRLMRVFDEFCIFEDDISLNLCRVFEGPNHVFLCIQGDADAIDTILRTGDDFLQNVRQEDKVALLSYCDFRDRMFLGQKEKYVEPQRNSQHVSMFKKHKLVLSCLYGLPVKSSEVEVDGAVSLDAVVQMAKTWLGVSDTCLVTLLVWDGAKFLNVVKTFEDLWAHGNSVGDSVSLQVLLEPMYQEAMQAQRYSFLPAKPLQWTLFAALQEPFMFSVECTSPTAQAGLALVGPVEHMIKLEEHHKNGKLEFYCDTKIVLMQKRMIKSQTMSYGEMDVREKELERKHTRDEVHKRLRRQIRAIESQLGVIRPGVSLKSATPGTPRLHRTRFILKGVTEQLEGGKSSPVMKRSPSKNKLKIRSTSNPSRDAKAKAKAASIRKQLALQLPLRGRSNDLAGGHQPPNSPVIDKARVEKFHEQQAKITEHRKQMNDLVKRLRSKKSNNAIGIKPSTSLQIHSDPDCGPGENVPVRRYSSEPPSIHNPSEDEQMDFGFRSDLDTETDSLDVDSDYTVDAENKKNDGEELTPFTKRAFDRLDTVRSGKVTVSLMKEAMMSTSHAFTTNELNVLFESTPADSEITYDEFHAICHFGYFGTPASEEDVSEA